MAQEGPFGTEEYIQMSYYAPVKGRTIRFKPYRLLSILQNLLQWLRIGPSQKSFPIIHIKRQNFISSQSPNSSFQSKYLRSRCHPEPTSRVAVLHTLLHTMHTALHTLLKLLTTCSESCKSVGSKGLALSSRFHFKYLTRLISRYIFWRI